MKPLLFSLLFLLTLSCTTYRSSTNDSRQKKQRTSAQELRRLSNRFGLPVTADDNLQLYTALDGWLGVRYKWGGNTKSGVDCSGLVKVIYKQVYNVDTERNSALLLKNNCLRLKRASLREGDLVFFHTNNTGSRNTPTHVGLYLKNNRFIHVSATKGVVVSDLRDNYYVRNWICGGRVIRKRR